MSLLSLMMLLSVFFSLVLSLLPDRLVDSDVEEDAEAEEERSNARSANIFTTSSVLATPLRIHSDDNDITPRNNNALAAARSGHGPLIFCRRILRGLF